MGNRTVSLPQESSYVIKRRERDAAIVSATLYFLEHTDGPFPARHDIENIAAGCPMEDVPMSAEEAQAILGWWDKLDTACERRARPKL